MPIVVDPGYVWPPEVDPVVSPDGRITAIVDPAHAGVLLRADYSDQGDDSPLVNLWRGSKLSSDRSAFSGSRWESERRTSLGWEVTAGDPGTGAYSLVYTTTAYRVPVEPNTPYSWSIPVQNTGDKPFGFRIMSWLEPKSGSQVSQFAAFTIAPGEKRVVKLENMLAGADPNDIRFSLYYGANDPKPEPGAKITLLDGITLVASETASDPFNGDSPSTDLTAYSWSGPIGSSTSLATPVRAKLVAKIRFERQDGSLVRSGNPAWAPGGYAHAYDHEATLGGGTLWRAVPIHFDGTEGEPSEYVGAVIPPLSDGWAWLKPVTDPDKAMLLKVEPPDLSYDGRVDTTSIAGAPRPAATWDVLEGFNTQLRSLVREKNVEEQLMALLDEGPVLAQFPACAGLPDFYFIRGKLDLEHVHWDGWPWRRYQWDVVQIDRPDTTDSPLRIPGLSYDTVARDWTTYDQLKSTVDSYNKLLEP